MGWWDSTTNALKTTQAVPPPTTVGASDPVLQKNIMYGYLNKDATNVHKNIVVGIVNQPASSRGSLGEWEDGVCMSPDGCAEFGSTPQGLEPMCCNAASIGEKTDLGWWAKPSDSENGIFSGPCWKIRGGYPVDNWSCPTIFSTCKNGNVCTNSKVSTCPTLAGVAPSPTLTDFLFTLEGVEKEFKIGQPVVYNQGIDMSSKLDISLFPGYSQLGCVYERKKILESLDAMKAFRTAFGPGLNSCDLSNQDDWYKLMKEYSFTIVSGGKSNCLYGGVGKTCARLHQKGAEGDFCREWWNKLPSVCRDNLALEYCNAAGNEENDDCGCVQRGMDESYNIITTALNKDGKGLLPAHCWFRPCLDPTTQFVTSDVENQSCDNIQICQQVIAAMNNDSVTFSGPIKQVLNCTISGTQKDPIIDEPDNDNVVPPPVDNAEKARLWMEKNWWVLLAAGGGVLLLVILSVIGYTLFSKKT